MFVGFEKTRYFRVETSPSTTEFVTVLDWQSELIVFDSILKTFERSVVFEVVGEVVKHCLKSNHYKQL